MRHRFKHYARHQRNFYCQANPPPHAYTANQRSHHQRRHAIQSCVPPYTASTPTLLRHAHATNATPHHATQAPLVTSGFLCHAQTRHQLNHAQHNITSNHLLTTHCYGHGAAQHM
ncbi:hypothetical protein Pmani_023875 [Petrolisthes manimaculis]|uniref:Uncharacterized protein n=1 Tax=Petrolisthes manimaculis TaxID=1843537 RepID=A0AAE1P8N5_9EUCA|nr:hypothetical protein Pmani_023875 [Petrolisthes manimaculis]